jgi:excinuclease ABC subunit B
MQAAIDETNRRRAIQERYNQDNQTSPQTVQKIVRETVRSYDAVNEVANQYSAEVLDAVGKDGAPVRIEDIPLLVDALEKEMKDLAKAMEFEKAAKVRDEIGELRKLIGTSGGRLGQEKRHNRRFKRGRD